MADSPNKGNELIPAPPKSLSQQAPREVIPFTARSVSEDAPSLRPEDEYSAIQAELADLANSKAKASEPARKVASRQSSWVGTVALSVIHLGFALGGFFVLGSFALAAVLWCLFLLVVYPILLAFFTRPEELPNGDLVELYKVGVSQIPAMGKLLSPLLGSKKND